MVFETECRVISLANGDSPRSPAPVPLPPCAVESREAANSDIYLAKLMS